MRIVVDTAELDQLAASHRQARAETSELSLALARGMTSTALNTADRTIATAQVSARYGDINATIRWVEASYGSDSQAIADLRNQFAAEERSPWGGPGLGGGIRDLLQLLAPWRGGLAEELAAVALYPFAAAAGVVDRLRRDIATRFTSFSKHVVEVGRSAVNRTTGLLTSAGRWLTDAKDRFVRWIKHTSEEAWNRLADGVSEIFRRAAAEIRTLVQGFVSTARSVQQALSQVGHWTINTAVPAIVSFGRAVKQRGLAAYHYVFDDVKYDPPSKRLPRPSSDTIVGTKEDDLGLKLTLLLGFNPGVGITKTYYADGSVDVTLKEQVAITAEGGIGGKAGAGAEATVSGGIKGTHTMTWHFANAEEAEKFIHAAEQRYTQELLRYITLMAVPFGYYAATGRGAPSFVAIGNELWNQPVEERWGGGASVSVKGEANAGFEKATAGISEGVSVDRSVDRTTGDTTWKLSHSLSGDVGLSGPLSARLGAGETVKLSVTTGADGHVKTLGVDLENKWTATAGLKALGVDVKAGKSYRYTASGRLPVDGELRALAERALNERSPEAMNALLERAGHDMKITLNVWEDSSIDDSYGISGDAVVRAAVAGERHHAESTHVTRVETTLGELARLVGS